MADIDTSASTAAPAPLEPFRIADLADRQLAMARDMATTAAEASASREAATAAIELRAFIDAAMLAARRLHAALVSESRVRQREQDRLARDAGGRVGG